MKAKAFMSMHRLTTTARMGISDHLVLRALQGLLNGSHLVRLLCHLLLQLRVPATHNLTNV